MVTTNDLSDSYLAIYVNILTTYYIYVIKNKILLLSRILNVKTFKRLILTRAARYPDIPRVDHFVFKFCLVT